MKKLKDIVLKKGDIVEFYDGELWFIPDSSGETADTLQQVKSIKRPTQYETIYEAPHEILDKEEKEWLEHFLRPFRNKVQYITKYKTDDINGQFIYIKLTYDCVWLPYFEENSMYKGMKVGKRYTLKELGLFE